MDEREKVRYMTAKITVVLGAIIAASVIANVYLYQQSTVLEGAVSQLQITNKELSDSLANARNNQTSSTTHIIPSSNQLQSSGNKNDSNPVAGSTSQSITAVAVKAVPVTDGFFESVQYQGTTMEITVDVRNEGKGLVLVNTEVPTGVDFQTSARTAVKVAQSITGTDLSNKDVIFSIKSKGNSTSSDLQAVDGPSAGAAMTVLLTTELQGGGANGSAGLKQDVVMTGTINPDGTVGQVGGVPEKAQAAGQYGAKIFLVPIGQNVYNEQTCEKRQEGLIIYQTCKSEQKPLSDYTEKNYGMKVVEVKDVKEALAYIG
jgi:uncharacterized protein